jgi:hypothetical protein
MQHFYKRFCLKCNSSYLLLLLIWLDGPSLRLGRFFSFLIPYTVGRTPWAGNQPVAGPLLHKEQHKHRINAHRHPCLEWDSNPRSQRPSERRQFMPQTARPLWSAFLIIVGLYALQNIPWERKINLKIYRKRTTLKSVFKKSCICSYCDFQGCDAV